MAYGNSFQRTTPIVLNLIIINTLIYVAQVAFGGMEQLNRVNDLFALHHYKSIEFKPHQLVTHMFMHGSFFHLLFNMLGLWMFGTMIERVWGPKRFLTFYLICGLGAGLAQMGSYIYDFWQIDHTAISTELYNQYQTALRINCTVGASVPVQSDCSAVNLFILSTRSALLTAW